MQSDAGAGYLSSIPVIGGPAAEFFDLTIKPPIERRRDKFLENVSKEFAKLRNKVDSFRVEELSKNELFITVVMQATQVALRNHQEEKLVALQYAVVNAALYSEPDEDELLMFMNYIDIFTTWHLKTLKLCDSKSSTGYKPGIAREQMIGLVDKALEKEYPQLQGKHEFYFQIVKDLVDRGLITEDAKYALAATEDK